MPRLVSISQFAESKGLNPRAVARWVYRYHIEKMAVRPSLGRRGGLCHMYALDDLSRVWDEIQARKASRKPTRYLKLTASKEFCAIVKEHAEKLGITPSALVRIACIRYMKEVGK